MDEEGSRPRASRRTEIVTGIVVAVMVLATAVLYPPFREGIDGARRSVAAMFGLADWAGYYLELDPTALPGELSSPQLLFTSGSFRGRSVRVVDAPVFPGRWSPSGDRFAFTSGRRLLIGDKSGAIRSLGELLDLTPAGPPAWVHENELILTMGRPESDGWWYVRIDPSSGLLLDQRAMPRHLTIDSISPDGRFALAMTSRAPSGTPRANLALYDLSTGAELPAPEGVAYAGWATGDRALVRVGAGDRWRLEAREIGADNGELLRETGGAFDVPVGVRGGWVALVERYGEGNALAAIWLVGRGADPRRVATDLRNVAEALPSGDGRYVALSMFEGADLTVPRTAILDVASGRVTYACETGCAALRLR